MGQTKMAITVGNWVAISLGLFAGLVACEAPSNERAASVAPAPIVVNSPTVTQTASGPGTPARSKFDGYYVPWIEVTNGSNCKSRDMPVTVINGHLKAQFNSRVGNWPEGDVAPDGTFKAVSGVDHTEFTGQIVEKEIKNGKVYTGCTFEVTKMLDPTKT